MNTFITSAMPAIQTNRLVVNPLTLDDINPFYAHRTHPDVLRYQGEFPRSEEDVRQLINMQNSVPFGTIDQWFQFAIRLLPNHIFIGDMGIHFNSAMNPQFEIAYSVAPAFHRKGYASESVQVMINYCVSNMNIKVITATIDVRNTASMHVLQKMGFQRVAYRPHTCFIRGEWCDEEDYVLFTKA